MRRVLFLHPQVTDLDAMMKYLYVKDRSIVKNLVWDEDNPEVVIASEHIYSNRFYYSVFKKLYHPDKIFVFHGGESAYPDMNIFDYAIAYCTYLSEFDRIIKSPEGYFFFHQDAEKKNVVTEEMAMKDLKSKGFCSFIYSNSGAHPNRDKFFFDLNNYKTVSSLGGHLNNTNVKPTRSNANWLNESIRLKQKFKFSIAFENETFPGYVTEKLLSSFRAHTVPIYWGNPNVCDYYNPDAFINCHSYKSFEEVIERIKEVDADDRLWAKMVSSPWQTDEQEERSKCDYVRYQCFLERIFRDDDFDNLVRRPFGAWTNRYYEWYFRKFWPNPLYKRIIRKIKNGLS